MTSEIWRDAGVGEFREVLVSDGRPIALRVRRWSDEGRRPFWGESYAARVRSVSAPLRGAFLDLGLEEGAFMRLDAKGEAACGDKRVPIREGASFTIRITREPARDKSAVAELLLAPPPEGAPRLLARPEMDEDLLAARPLDAERRAELDQWIDEALAPSAPIPGGGVLWIEPTRALVAIDVDAATRQGPKEPERFARALNLAAAAEAARQLRLRSLGGLVVIDFLAQRDRRVQADIVEALKQACAGDPAGVTTATMSRFGLVELSRGQLLAPLHETMLGARAAESEALRGLAALLREAESARGRRLRLHLEAPAARWLAQASIRWREALHQRIGALWEIAQEPAARMQVEVLP